MSALSRGLRNARGRSFEFQTYVMAFTVTESEIGIRPVGFFFPPPAHRPSEGRWMRGPISDRLTEPPRDRKALLGKRAIGGGILTRQIAVAEEHEARMHFTAPTLEPR